MKRNGIVLLVLFICSSFSESLIAQDSNIPLKTKLLEHIVKDKIDKFRTSKGLQPLVNDSILYVASKDHGTYLNQKFKITHYQKNNSEKKTPQRRATFYGAKNYRVGENIVEVSANTGNEYSVGEAMVEAWLNSPGHYANIVTDDYDITGVTITFNKYRNSYICVQKFAIVNELYAIKPNKQLFPFEGVVPKSVSENFVKELPKKHKRHAFKIKESKKEEICPESNSEVFVSLNTRIDLNNDSIYLLIKKKGIHKIKNYFKEKKDGLLIEFVVFKHTYSCELTDNVLVPTRRNGRCEFNGPITKPRYKKYILEEIDKRIKYNRINKIRLDRDEYIKVSLARFPNNLRGEKIEINLLVLKKNRVCRVIESVSVCGKEMLNPLPILPYRDNLTPITYVPKMKPSVKRIKVKFGKNETANTSDVVKDAINELKNNHHEIIKADIKAYASVEGTREANVRLFKRRAEGVLKQFEAHQDSTIKYKLTTKENWRMFFKQIDTTDLNYLKDLDTTKIREFVNDTANAEVLNPFLDKQRFAFITLYTKPKMVSENLIPFALDNYNHIMRQGSYSSSNIAKLVEIQQFLFGKVRSGEIDQDTLSLQFPKNDPRFTQMAFNQLMFDYKYGEVKLSHRYMADAFKNLNKLNSSNSDLVYNGYAALFNSKKYQEIGTRLKNTINMLKLFESYPFKGDTVYQFQLHKNHLIVNKYYNKLGGRLKPSIKSIKFVKEHYDPMLDSLGDDFKFEMAKYYVFSEQYVWAMELLKPLANKKYYDHEVYILYLIVYQQLQTISRDYDDLNLVLIDAQQKLTKSEWCNLFSGGGCNINFQIFEDQALKNLYCSSCRTKSR